MIKEFVANISIKEAVAIALVSSVIIFKGTERILRHLEDVRVKKLVSSDETMAKFANYASNAIFEERFRQLGLR